MDEDFQTQEELDAHCGPGGPVAAAEAWVTHARNDDNVEEAWKLSDPNFRLVIAQDFLWANRTHPFMVGYDLDEVAASLASTSFDHDLWPDFEEQKLDEWDEAFDDFFQEGKYGAASRPRPTTPGYEVVKFFEAKDGQEFVVTKPTLLVGYVFLMHSTPGGWLMAGIGDETPPEPGWPPKRGIPAS